MTLLQQAGGEDIAVSGHDGRPEPKGGIGAKGRSWTRRILSLCAALVAVGALALGSISPASADDPGCGDLYICVYSEVNFSGTKRVIGAGEAGHWIPFDHAKQSLKNLNYNRRVFVASTLGVYCLGPYTRWPVLAPTYYLWIDVPGSRC